jgi:hypothetical protein
LTTFGNELSRRETEAAVLKVPRFLTLSGPEHVGKASFVKAFLESSLDEADLLVAESGPDGARQARPFLSDRPSFSPFRAVLIDDIDVLSEPAQDSWLKLCEEAPESSCIIAVSSDPRSLLPPLLSRVVRDVRWFPLSDVEMAEFAASLEKDVDDLALKMACGRPGLYPVLCTRGFVALHESVLSSVADPSFELAVPAVVKDLESGRSPERTAVSMVVRKAALSLMADAASRDGALAFLRFAGDIVRVPSANAEIHWRNAVMSSLKM